MRVITYNYNLKVMTLKLINTLVTKYNNFINIYAVWHEKIT